MEEKKEFEYTLGIFDVICRAIRKKVQEGARKESSYGLGVYTDEFCENELLTLPMKNFEERKKIAQSFEGIDFVFKVDTKDTKRIEELAEEAYNEYKEKKRLEEKDKDYKVGFVIGSFDVLHAGHIENLTLAKKKCEKLVVILKTDERISKNKHKLPKQSFVERKAILSCIGIIDRIICMDIDTNRRDIISDILEAYENIKEEDIVAIFGSDLQEKEQKYIDTDWRGISVMFTDRDPEKMKIVSSSNYQKICDENGGIEELVRKEESYII